MSFIEFIGIVSFIVEFGGQTSKNVLDIRKMCLEMTLCVQAYFVKFYVFVFYETHRRSCLAKNIQGPTKVPWGRTHVCGQNCPKTVHLLREIDIQSPGWHPVGCGRRWNLRLGSQASIFKTLTQSTVDSTVCKWNDAPSMSQSSMNLCLHATLC